MTARSRTTGDSPAAFEPPAAEFVQEFTRQQRKLFLYILSQIPSPIEAEEILQETNLVIWRKCREFEPGTNFAAWSTRIARLEVLKYLDRRQRDRARFSPALVELLAEEVLEDEPRLEERRKALAYCLQKLKARDCELIERRYAPGASGTSLAETLGRPANSIYQSLSRIRRTLMDCINRRLAEAQA
ncbi:MAG: sigma-70 family RNA polymerase sigma factor [Planctomycetes bacterium]|nr:sigma-70 family RNA polymerase sigma factor [Planctomycetota bacterium]